MRVKDVIDRVTLMYHDKEYIRLTKRQYLQLLDDALLQLVLTRPDSHEKREIVQLAVGTKQKLPNNAITLLDIYLNKDYIEELDDYVDGKAVYQVARKDLDYFKGNWHKTIVPYSDIDEFAYDMRTPKTYLVNPPVHALSKVFVEIGYSCPCEEFAMMLEDESVIFDLTIPVAEEYRNALVNYMLYLCYSVNSTSENDQNTAQRYFQTFMQLLGVENTSSISGSAHIKEDTTSGLGLYTTGTEG